MFACISRSVLFLLAFAAVSLCDDYNFTSLSVPGAQGATGINDEGTVVGSANLNNTSYGFALSTNQLSYFKYPGAEVTRPEDISNNGRIAGDWYASIQGSNGFVSTTHGYESLRYPGSATTFADGINNSGTVVGEYQGDFGQIFGFTWQDGTWSTLDLGSRKFTVATGINDSGEIVGAYDATDKRSGFIMANGTVQTFDVPGADYTVPLAIDDKGDIAGFFWYPDYPNSPQHGFVYSDGAFQILDFPGADGTEIDGINDAGVIVGQYDSGSQGFAFEAYPVPECPEIMMLGTGFAAVGLAGLLTRFRLVPRAAHFS